MAYDKCNMVIKALTNKNHRFYKKSDIAKDKAISKQELSWIGENEVFETNHKSKIFADLLNGKCKIWDIQEYDGKTGLGGNDFYSRARYNIENVLDHKYLINRNP